MAARTSLLVALALTIAFATAACGGSDTKESKHEPSASSSVTSTPTTTPTTTPTLLDPASGLPTGNPSTSLPKDFPTADVPILSGPVSQPIGEGSPEQGWVLEVELAKKADDCFTAAATALAEHGFTQQPGETNNNGHREALFNSATYAVIISTDTSDSGGCRLGYEVGKVSR